MRVIQIQYATAQDMADKVQKLFESQGAPAAAAGATRRQPATVPPPGARRRRAAGARRSPGGGARGPATLSQLIPDERTNKLIVSPAPPRSSGSTR